MTDGQTLSYENVWVHRWPQNETKKSVSLVDGERQKIPFLADEKRSRDTEGTCYALRDMAEACGIHNFVETKMLRSCLGGATFFLVSRNVYLCSGCLASPLVPWRGHSAALFRTRFIASSLSRFAGNAPRNEKRFVKNVSASSCST